MIIDRDIFVTEIINRKIGIKLIFNKERKKAKKNKCMPLGTMNISVGLCTIIYNNVWDKIYFGYNILARILPDV